MASASPAEAEKQWKKFLTKCLCHRLREARLDSLIEQMHSQHYLSGARVAQILLAPDPKFTHHVDALVPHYVERLLSLRVVDTSDILLALYKGSRDQRPSATNGNDAGKNAEPTVYNPLQLEDILLNQLASLFISGNRPKTINEARRTIVVTSNWMAGMAASSAKDDAVLQAITHPRLGMLRDTFGLFVIRLLSNAKVVGVLTTAIAKRCQKEFKQALSQFMPVLAHNQTVYGQLDMLQKQHNLVDGTKKTMNKDEAAEVTNALQLEATADLQQVNTRAGVYVFLNAMLVARPLTDDSLILNWLHMRYKGDIQNQFTDLIAASFDVLANVLYNNEWKDSHYRTKAFLIHKLPVLLTHLSASLFPPLTAAFCIGQALTYVDTNAFPTFSQSFGTTSASDPEAKQQFLFACTSHGLLPREDVEGLLGEKPMEQIPNPGNRLSKDDLVHQCSANIGKAESLIKQLEKWDGNAGAIVGAITELIRNLCHTKETTSLKSLCNAITRNPKNLEIFLLFTSPSNLLQPLAQLLDAWNYDDDPGEYQPVYDEFAAILLLVLAFAYRYDLNHQDMGISNNSFAAHLLERGSHAQPLSELSEEQNKHLEGWIKALYDSEGAGLSDEVLSLCKPQDFYLLIPTIFEQTCLSCSEGVLSVAAMKTGLEYFHETFLLPSVISAIIWLTTYAWTTHSRRDAPTLLQILLKLVRPSSISGDAQAMHAAVISIISPRLRECLAKLHGREQHQKDIQALTESTKKDRGYSSSRPTAAASTELQSWGATHGFEQSIHNTLQSLTIWASTTSMTNVGGANFSSQPPAYTHRHILTAVKRAGSFAVLSALLEEIKTQTEQGNGSFAIDIASAIICSPTFENSPITLDSSMAAAPVSARRSARLNLRDTLKLRRDEASDVVAKDLALAEAIVRFHRRVEAQLAVQALPDLAAGVEALLPALDITTVGDATGAGEQSIEQALGLGATGDLTNIDLTVPQGDAALNAMSAMQGMGAMDLADAMTSGDAALGEGMDVTLPDADEDMFAGLGVEDGGMDGMDMDWDFA